MTKFRTSLAVLALVIAAATGAQASAAVLTFDDLTHNDSTFRLYGDAQGRFEYEGFLFEHAYSETPSFLVFGADDPRNADPGGATFAGRWDSHFTTISRLDGLTFDLASIDVADLANVGANVHTQWRFAYADGTSEFATFVTDSAVGLETYAFNRTNLVSFGYQNLGGRQWVQFDNITFADPSTGAVPEPATWAMMLIGFFGLGSVVRRSRRQVAIAA